VGASPTPTPEPLSLLSSHDPKHTRLTGDLGNLDALDPAAAAKLPSLMAVKAALYSEAFRSAVRAITGCGPLAPTTDCSANVYARGGHLLTHDDVIGSRRVSWILYLTDPDDGWDVASDGGGLELFPLAAPGAKGTPATEPTTTLPPSWNSLAMFTVQPGVSFHAVQEVVSAAKPRLSISGWFHAPAAPDGGATDASLAQLQLRRGADCLTGHALFAENTDADPSPADLETLAPWVNPAYLKPGAWAAVRARFEADGSVQLHRFLRADVAARVCSLIKAADADDGLGGWRLPADPAVGQRGGWAVRGPPHKQRFLVWEGDAADPASLLQQGGDGDGDATNDADPAATAGAALAAIQTNLFQSPAFARLLRACTTVAMLGVAPEGPRRFRAGLDYTVAHFGAITAAPRLDAVLCFVDDEGEGDGDTCPWAAGDVGGFEAYLLADEDEDGDKGGKAGGSSASASAAAAAVYRAADADAGVINAPASPNCLNLTLRDDGLMRFVKYVSAGAPGSRWDVAVEFLPEDDGEEDEDEEEEGEKKKGGGEEAGQAGGGGGAE
jgi:prolyl 3-hydroxylase /prolyl 3,4-dihydroxylase